MVSAFNLSKHSADWRGSKNFISLWEFPQLPVENMFHLSLSHPLCHTLLLYLKPLPVANDYFKYKLFVLPCATFGMSCISISLSTVFLTYL